MPRLLSTLVLLMTFLSSASLAAQQTQTPTDLTGTRNVNLAVYSDFHYSAKTFLVPWINRNHGDTAHAQSVSKVLNNVVVSRFIDGYGLTVELDKVNIVTVAEVETILSKIDPKNNNERGFLFLAPAPGEYKVVISIPGGSGAPRATIELYDSANSSSLIDYKNVPNMSGATQTFWVALQKGVCGLKVASSTTAAMGYLDSLTLDNPTYLNWIWTEIPTKTDEQNLSKHLPAAPDGNKPGSTCDIPLAYPHNPTDKIHLHSPANGHFTVSAPYGVSYSAPLQRTYKIGTLHLHAQPTAEEEALIAGGPYGIHLDYQEISTPTVKSATHTIHFNFQRKANFTSHWTYHVIYQDVDKAGAHTKREHGAKSN